jgi:hypothetical protein
VGDGKATDFWRDAWCGSISLKEKFSGLFSMCTEPSITVSTMARSGWRLSFRRWLDVQNQEQYRQ